MPWLVQPLRNICFWLLYHVFHAQVMVWGCLEKCYRLGSSKIVATHRPYLWRLGIQGRGVGGAGSPEASLLGHRDGHLPCPHMVILCVPGSLLIFFLYNIWSSWVRAHPNECISLFVTPFSAHPKKKTLF